MTPLPRTRGRPLSIETPVSEMETGVYRL
ncbi:protein of unknown function (plasmid) [Methylocella tundrae]|uniref:Uncharacterized protein n=1 Tax=Methylocella tundrae TaxID=227605 RepID=A0A4V6IN74_METTU|nr:protein of unknown function [Methylocella tundrae]